MVENRTREEWLEDHGAREGDVIQDEDGDEYILDEVENGNPGEDGYSVDTKKIYIPTNI